MVDVFDMNTSGYGFHITSHLIALVALFIACFAIAGYINFRTNSIPADAVKEGSGFADEDLVANSLSVSQYRFGDLSLNQGDVRHAILTASPHTTTPAAVSGLGTAAGTMSHGLALSIYHFLEEGFADSAAAATGKLYTTAPTLSAVTSSNIATGAAITVTLPAPASNTITPLSFAGTAGGDVTLAVAANEGTAATRHLYVFQNDLSLGANDLIITLPGTAGLDGTDDGVVRVSQQGSDLESTAGLGAVAQADTTITLANTEAGLKIEKNSFFVVSKTVVADPNDDTYVVSGYLRVSGGTANNLAVAYS